MNMVRHGQSGWWLTASAQPSGGAEKRAQARRLIVDQRTVAGAERGGQVYPHPAQILARRAALLAVGADIYAFAPVVWAFDTAGAEQRGEEAVGTVGRASGRERVCSYV